MPINGDTAKAESYPCANPGASVFVQITDSRASGIIGDGDTMKNGKYWGGRLRSLTDAVASAVAITALGATGLAQAAPNIEAFPWVAVGLTFALVFWYVGSVASKVLEESDDG